MSGDNETGGGTSAPPARRPADDRWGLVWDVLMFQVKLGLDALRDFVLSPLSFGALILGLIAGGDRPGRYFEGILRFGRRTERVINLFGTSRAPHDPYAEPDNAAAVDNLFDNVEELLRRNVDRNATTAAARARVDETIDELEARLERLRKRARERFRPDGDGSAGTNRS